MKQLFESIKVSVGVKKSVSSTQTERGNEAVDRLPNRAAPLTQPAIVVRGGHRQFDTACVEDLKPSQLAQYAGGFVVAREALENFADHQIEEPKSLPRDFLI